MSQGAHVSINEHKINRINELLPWHYHSVSEP